MASCLVRFGRFAFFVLLGLQAYSLASYPAKYKENDGYYGLTALFLPAFALRLYIMISNKHLQWLFVVWLLYVIGLVIFIGIIFGGPAPVEDRFKWTTKSSGDVNNLTNCNESTNVTNAINSTTSLSHSTNLTFSTEQITWVCFHYLRESDMCGFVKFTIKKVHYKIQNETKMSIKSFII